jgi:DNA-binding response OmpR family regulator
MAPRDLLSRRARILCIEEDPYLADLLHYVLAREGYRVRVAASRAVALRMVRVEPCDLALLDVHLPGINGYSLCSCRQGETSVGEAALTARYADLARTHREQDGSDFFPKPFRLQALLVRIRTTLASTEPAGQPGIAKIRLLRPQEDLVGAGSGQMPAAATEQTFLVAEG